MGHATEAADSLGRCCRSDGSTPAAADLYWLAIVGEHVGRGIIKRSVHLVPVAEQVPLLSEFSGDDLQCNVGNCVIGDLYG